MAIVVSQHVRNLGFFKTLIFRRTATNFTGISRKHVFLAPDKKIIENRVKKNYLEQIFLKVLQFSVSNFYLHN